MFTKIILIFLKIKNKTFNKIKVKIIIHNSTKLVERNHLYNNNLTRFFQLN